jgi:hypothetical protein
MNPVLPFSSSPSIRKATLMGAALPADCQQSSSSWGGGATAAAAGTR